VDESRRLYARDAVVVVVLMTLSGLGSLWLGQDLNVDLQNYHFWNGYSFLTGRTRDIAPAAMWSFFNPVMDGFHYWGMSHLPARVFGFLIGAVHGLNPALVYLIARALFVDATGPQRLLAIGAGVASAIGPDAVILLGTSTGDTLSATPLLAAVLFAVHGARDAARGRPWLLAAAGTSAGIAVGLKLTAAPYAVALAAALVLTSGSLPRATRAAACFGAGGTAGYLAAGGFWCLRLWRSVGNPVFPFANSFFRSPYGESAWLRNDTWVPRTLWDHVAPPFWMAAGETARLTELFQFRDARLLVLFAAVLALVFRYRLRRPLERPEKLVLVFMALAYLLWLKLFYYYRYATLLELLAPVALYLVLRAACPSVSSRRLAAVYVGLLAALALYARYDPRSMGRHDHWADGWFEVRLPRLATMPGAIVLTDLPNSFVFPFLPADDRFLRLRIGRALLEAEVQRAIADHTGPILYFAPIGARMLAEVALRETGHCEPLHTNRGEFRICLAERASVR
jgi:hypothetical protein